VVVSGGWLDREGAVARTMFGSKGKETTSFEALEALAATSSTAQSDDCHTDRLIAAAIARDSSRSALRHPNSG
jgi:hypothetical protein